MLEITEIEQFHVAHVIVLGCASLVYPKWFPNPVVSQRPVYLEKTSFAELNPLYTCGSIECRRQANTVSNFYKKKKKKKKKMK